jgi:erythromycin esterase-like protein
LTGYGDVSGELCRTAYNEKAVSIGFGTDRGTVAAADNWDRPMHIKKVIPSRKDSYEQLFLRAGHPCSVTDLRERLENGKYACNDK